MVVVQPSFQIINPNFDPVALLKHVEYCARTCYKSEDKITEDSYVGMVSRLVKLKHFAMLEHAGFTAKFVTDRGVTHELVRHRLASFGQESTRYCNYGKAGEIAVTEPNFWQSGSERDFKLLVLDNYLQKESERVYMQMLDLGATPQEARRVLTNAVKAEIVVTANLREWRHIFDLRAVGSTGAPHPDMIGIMRPFLDSVKAQIPIVFDDLVY